VTVNHDMLVEGRCFACGMPYRDHTAGQLDACLDAPLAIIVVEDEDQQ
jgi:hypothetical protein